MWHAIKLGHIPPKIFFIRQPKHFILLIPI